MSETRREDFPEIGAAVILGVDVFCAVRMAFYGEDRWPVAKDGWTRLSRDEKQRYIDTAAALLETFRPHAPRGEREIVTVHDTRPFSEVAEDIVAERENMGFDSYAALIASTLTEAYRRGQRSVPVDQTCSTCRHLAPFELSPDMNTCPVVNIRIHTESAAIFGCNQYEGCSTDAITPKES